MRLPKLITRKETAMPNNPAQVNVAINDAANDNNRNEKSATVLLATLHAAIKEGLGEPRPGASYIQAVAEDDLRDVFIKRHRTSSIDVTDARKAAHKAFDRASKWAINKGMVETNCWDGQNWFWPAEDGSAPS